MLTSTGRLRDKINFLYITLEIGYFKLNFLENFILDIEFRCVICIMRSTYGIQYASVKNYMYFVKIQSISFLSRNNVDSSLLSSEILLSVIIITTVPYHLIIFEICRA